MRSVGKVLEKEDPSKLPSSLALGLSYHYVTGIHAIDANLDGDWYFTNNWSVAAGFTYGINDMGFVRIGYRYSSKYAAIPSHLAIGVGGKFKGVLIDFSYITLNKVVGNTFRFGLGYSF